MCCSDHMKHDHTKRDNGNQTWEDANHTIIATVVRPVINV